MDVCVASTLGLYPRADAPGKARWRRVRGKGQGLLALHLYVPEQNTRFNAIAYRYLEFTGREEKEDIYLHLEV